MSLKNKKGVSKRIISFMIVSVLILAIAGVVAQTALNNDNNSDNIQEVGELSESEKQTVSEKSEGVSDAIKGYIEEFVKKRGIKPEDINEVGEVDIGNLPEDINIENVNDANLAIYEVNYNETSSGSNTNGKQDEIFVITYSSKKLEQGDLIFISDKRQFLNFGLNREARGSTFLDTATGVPSNVGLGYVMMRQGSITGLSTILEVVNATEGKEIEVLVYKNDELSRFSNVIYTSLDGLEKDYDIQSKGVVSFNPGDVISIYVNTDDNVSYKNVITMLEITTTD